MDSTQLFIFKNIYCSLLYRLLNLASTVISHPEYIKIHKKDEYFSNSINIYCFATNWNNKSQHISNIFFWNTMIYFFQLYILIYVYLCILNLFNCINAVNKETNNISYMFWWKDLSLILIYIILNYIRYEINSCLFHIWNFLKY